MTPGYTEDPYSDYGQRSPKSRYDRSGYDPRNSGPVDPYGETYPSNIPPPPPVPRRPPPRSRARPMRSGPPRQYNDDYYDDGYSNYNRGGYRNRPVRPPPPPPPQRAQRSRPRYDDDKYGYDRYDDRDYDDRDYDRHRPKKMTPKHDSDRSSGGRGSGWITGIVILILILLIGYLFRGPIIEAIQNPPPLRYQEYPEGVDFTVRKSMTLQVNPTRQSSYISYKLKSACPKDSVMEDFYLQDVKDVKVQPEPSTGFPNINSQAQEIMLWEGTHFTGSKTFIVEYTITTRFYQWEFEESDSGTISENPSTLKSRYNHDEWRIDSDHDGVLDNEDDIDNDGQWDYMIEPTNPTIKSLANEIAGGEENVFKVVKKIYDYLTNDDTLNYVTSSQGLPKACTVTLSDLRGDCDDYSILFISLCRALDIPAWLELGVLYDREAKRWGGHAWSKVAIPLSTGGYSAPTVDIVNKQFLFFDPYRFIEWKDTGGDDIYPGEDKARNNLDYYYHTFSYISTGNPDIVSPNTNEFLTLSMDEFGDKKKIGVDGDESGLEACMIPGFDTAIYITSILFVVGFIFFSRINSKRKYNF
jgi:hypothetical protein